MIPITIGLLPALSSVLCKLLDHILLTKYHDVFTTSDYQYGFKKQHSTVGCTAVVNEIIQNYLNNNTNVSTVLLDASRAFDWVNYVKLFKLLMKRNLCPIITRFLANLYTTQVMRTKWGNVVSKLVTVTNGVKQGAWCHVTNFIHSMNFYII